MQRPKITVVGSANTDLTVMTERLPAPGETVLGSRLVRAGGGKGANQAVAAARGGAEVAFVGRVGDDEFGAATLAALRAEGIDIRHVGTDERNPSGVALIMVDGAGENLIAVAPGANARLGAADVEAARAAIASADLLLLQLEIPLDTVRAAIGIAQAAGVAVLLNPAPAPGCELNELCRRLQYLTPNRVEAAQLLGADPAQDPETTARALAEASGGTVFLTLGADGVCVCDGRECELVDAPPVRAVDSVGAGDCFAGTLAVAIAEGRPMREAARFAACGAALSVRKEGAQPSMPRREKIDRLIAQLNRKRAN